MQNYHPIYDTRKKQLRNLNFELNHLVKILNRETRGRVIGMQTFPDRQQFPTGPNTGMPSVQNTCPSSATLLQVECKKASFAHPFGRIEQGLVLHERYQKPQELSK